MDKLASIAKKLDVLAKIIYWFLLIGGTLVALCFCGMLVFSLLMPESRTLISTVSLGFVELEIAEKYLSNPVAARHLILAEVIYYVLGLPFNIWLIKCFRNILTPLKEKEPFNGAISANLKKAGWLIVAVGMIDNIGTTVLSRTIANGYHIENLLLSDKITGVTVHYTFDFTFVVVCAVLFLLAYIFRYGEQLQQLSDETL